MHATDSAYRSRTRRAKICGLFLTDDARLGTRRSDELADCFRFDFLSSYTLVQVGTGSCLLCSSDLDLQSAPNLGRIQATSRDRRRDATRYEGGPYILLSPNQLIV